jgi:aspartyl aminopeptidase
MNALLDFVQFLSRSPTVFHAAREISNRLAEADFTPLKEGEKWRFEPGKGYFILRGDSLVAAFRVPKQAPSSATILASHIDSPCLKLKPHSQQSSHEIGQLGTEVYGAPLLHTWLDRDLAIAGRISVMNGSALHSEIVTLDDSPVIIPSLALHLDRSVSEKGLLVHKQDHLKPVFSLRAKEKQLEEWLKKSASFEKLLSFDLFLTPLEKPSFVGFENELISAYRLDNLTAAYAALQALLQAAPRSDVLQMAFFWDHEEIGSMSYVGADSLFATQVLERICLFFKMDREDYYRLKSRSLCISGDLAHGFNPSFADKYDPQNAPFLGRGVVIKFNANQKYATSSITAAAMIQLAEKHKIPVQKFAGRSDIPSGSTVGSIMASTIGIPTVDVGIAGWAMHSARETIAAQDELSLCAFFKAALEEKFCFSEE